MLETLEESGKLRVLLVVAGKSEQTFTRETLEQLGFEVVIANDAAETRELFSASGFSLVLIQEQLGTQNGILVAAGLKQAQAHSLRPTTPIVLLSNSSRVGLPPHISLVVPLPLRNDDLQAIVKLIR